MTTTDNHSTIDRIISRAEFRQLTGIGRTSEHYLLKDGKLPPMVVICGRRLGYRESGYKRWLEANSVQA